MESINRQRRLLLTGAAALGLAATGLTQAQTTQGIEVWKDPNCGCCQDWISHLEQNGFKAKVFDSGNNAVRARLGMPQPLGSCHTALVQGYVIEGHVPAQDVKRLLARKPVAAGLSVPGMPVGSPGMEVGSRKDPYQVLLIDKAGRSSVFARYPKI